MIYSNPKIPHEKIFYIDEKTKSKPRNYYNKYFKDELNEFLIDGLTLRESKRYYNDVVYRFYCDNREELKTNILPFVELSKKYKKGYGVKTIEVTYPDLLDSWIEATKKPDYTIDELYNLCVKGSLPLPKDKYNKIISGSLYGDAKVEFDKGVKLSFIIRKYIYKENINTLCKSCGIPTKQLTNECIECCRGLAQKRASKKREIRMSKEIPEYMNIKKGKLNTEDFYNEEYLIECFKCKGTYSYVFGSRKREFHCPVCDKKHITSKEKEISLLVPECTINNRKILPPKELDIYSEKLKFAIEYNGLVWHSSGKSKHKMLNKVLPKSIHLDKTLRCKEKGITLYQIFENEWLDDIKKDIWVSKILGKQNQHIRIFARKCTIREITAKESKEFMDLNHLQGHISASINIGLFYDEDLVLVSTFSKARFKSKQEYELIRLASKKYITVVGGASKALKYFERKYNPKSIVSYANLRWSYGDVYSKLGFKYSHRTEPNYFYFKKGENILYSRIKFQKHKLNNLLENFDSNLTESENMYENGYRKIHDCGNLVFIKEF